MLRFTLESTGSSGRSKHPLKTQIHPVRCASTVTDGMPQDHIAQAKRAVFLAVLDEEEITGRCQRTLLDQIRAEVREQLG